MIVLGLPHFRKVEKKNCFSLFRMSSSCNRHLDNSGGNGKYLRQLPSVPAGRDLMLSVRLMQGRVSAAPEGNVFESVRSRWETQRNNRCLFSAGLLPNTVSVHVEQHKPQTSHRSELLSTSPSTTTESSVAQRRSTCKGCGKNKTTKNRLPG